MEVLHSTLDNLGDECEGSKKGTHTDDSLGDITLFKDSFDCFPGSTKTVTMDGAGDTHETYAIAEERGITLITPPKKRSVYQGNQGRWESPWRCYKRLEEKAWIPQKVTC